MRGRWRAATCAAAAAVAGLVLWAIWPAHAPRTDEAGPVPAVLEPERAEEAKDSRPVAGEPVPDAPIPEAAARLYGTVLDRETGTPVAGARLVVIGEETDDGAAGDPAAQAATEPDGAYELVVKLAGSATLRCAAPGYVQKEIPVDIDAPELRVDLLLQAGASVGGTVVDKDSGAPIAGAVVYVRDRAASALDPELQVLRAEVRSAPDGTYEIGEIPEGIYRVSVNARAQGFLFDITQAAEVEDETSHEP